MTTIIKSFDNNTKNEIENRRKVSFPAFRSVNINQTDGNFILTNSSKNTLFIYGQSPNISNSWFETNLEVKNLGLFGELNFPMDAKFDWIRRKIWVADYGNNRLLCIDYNTFLVDFEVKDVKNPCAIAINQNNGDVFVRAINTTEESVVYIFKKNGEMIESITFEDEIDANMFYSANKQSKAYSLPSEATMQFDNDRNRLWWGCDKNIFMLDMLNMDVSSFNITDYGLKDISSINIEKSTGNTLFSCQFLFVNKNLRNFSPIAYMYRDNNYIIRIANSYASIDPKEIEPESIPAIESGLTTAWPNKLVFSGFSNPALNGEWMRGKGYRGQLYSYICPNNTIVFDSERPNGQYGAGSFTLDPLGKYDWVFIFYTIKNYPVIDRKWVYKKRNKNKKPTGIYECIYYYSEDQSIPNEYATDKGIIGLA